MRRGTEDCNEFFSCGSKKMILKLLARRNDGVDLKHDAVNGHHLDTIQASLVMGP